MLPASGLGAITHVAGTAPQSGETAGQLLAQAQAEGQLLIDNTAAIHHEILAFPLLGPDGTDIANEYGPASDVAQFQSEISNALDALPPITAADEHNPFLVFELSKLLNAENSKNDTLVSLDTSWVTDQIMQMTADNAALIHNGDTIFDAAQNVVSYFAFEDFLQAIGL